MSYPDPHLNQLTNEAVSTPFATNLRDDLRELAMRDADRARPYVTVTLDYGVEGERPNVHPARPGWTSTSRPSRQIVPDLQ